MRQRFGLRILRIFSKIKPAQSWLGRVMKTSLPVLACRLVWGRDPQSYPPFHFVPGWRDVAYEWYGWWIIHIVVQGQKRCQTDASFQKIFTPEQRVTVELSVRYMLDVMEQYELYPSFIMLYTHAEFLRYFGMVCTWAVRLALCTGGKEDGLPAARIFLGILKKKALQEVRTNQKILLRERPLVYRHLRDELSGVFEQAEISLACAERALAHVQEYTEKPPD